MFSVLTVVMDKQTYTGENIQNLIHAKTSKTGEI